MFSELDLDGLVRRAILLHNKLRSPEVTAKSVSITPVAITISFSSGSCYECGVFDIVEGFAHEFNALTNKLELKAGKTMQINQRTFEADYNVKPK